MIKLTRSLTTFLCPQCRQPNPSSHRIYLSLSSTENVDMIKAELKMAELKLQDLENSSISLNQQDSNLFCQPFQLKGIIIKGIPKTDLKTPIIDTVLMLANIMELPCQNSDIEAVSFFGRKILLQTRTPQQKFNLVVKFTSQKIKYMFLDKSEKLCPKGIIVSDFMDEDTNELFQYAKSLETHGYEHIFYRHNGIFVQKTNGDTVLRICNKEDVDNLLI
ncbi:uncharacterized protein LOC101457291 isoform X2 [Ceratitis capitata]|uniref:uncharacterized protein LOC101457291 isoform X2 n=1 Tax=Ceratitis capitata TaxID=7213 RepID=UPI000A109420|nr:uncharacterized protein LOC101457291 isoform X2 [Ceratitis capitata]